MHTQRFPSRVDDEDTQRMALFPFTVKMERAVGRGLPPTTPRVRLRSDDMPTRLVVEPSPGALARVLGLVRRNRLGLASGVAAASLLAAWLYGSDAAATARAVAAPPARPSATMHAQLRVAAPAAATTREAPPPPVAAAVIPPSPPSIPAPRVPSAEFEASFRVSP
jgi:hypothetical protein